MKISRDGWILIGLFVMLAVVFAVFARSDRSPQSDLGTTYNASPSGVRAFYTLLGDRLGYRVERLEAPYTDMPKGASTLVVVAPLDSAPITPEETNALEVWIRAGGTAIFISDSLKNIPARFGSTRQIGKGFVYAMDSRGVISNKGLRDYRNAMKMLDVITKHSGPRDLILFDEYHHGVGRSKLQALLTHTARQIKSGALVIAIGLVVLCYGRGRRFGAVRELPSTGALRPEFEFVESIAKLYDRAGAADVAAEILLKSMRQGLCAKLGLSPDAPRDVIVRQLDAEGHQQTAGKVDWLLGGGHAGQKLSKSELVHVASEINSVEKELGLGGIIA